jgi:hypothetical protein
MVKIVRGKENIDEAKWDRFVRSHPAGNAFQRPSMYRVFEETVNYTPYVAACLDDDGSVTGVLQGAGIRNGRGIIGRMTSRVIVWGGPLVQNDDSNCITSLLNAFTEMIRKDAVYCEIRNLEIPDENIKQFFSASGFSYFPHLNIVVNVERSEKDLLAKMDPAKRRNVKKALKKGLGFGVIKKEEEIDTVYDILKGVYGKTGLPLSGISLFKVLFRNTQPDGHCTFYKVESEGRMIGVMVVLANNNSLYEWYVGAKEQFYHMRPNEFLVWNVMLEAKKEGKHFFDFGGAGKPGEEYGVRNFKKGFGGEILETGRFRIVFKRLPWLIGNAAIRLKKVFK